MAELSGTNLAGSIVPFTTDDTFATHLAKFGKGGWRSVADTAERDGITADRREAGMAVYVVSEKKVYTLESDLVTWTELKTGSGEIAVEHDDTLQGEGTEEKPLGVNTEVVATKEDVAKKQDKLTAGSNITIKNNVIFSTAQESFFRGRFSDWGDVSVYDADYNADSHGSRTPTENDYIVVEDASGYEPPALDTFTFQWSIENKTVTVVYKGVETVYGNGATYPIIFGPEGTGFRLPSNGGLTSEFLIRVNGKEYQPGEICWLNQTVRTVEILQQFTKLEGSWRFYYKGDWSEDNKIGWKPEYQIEETLPVATETQAGIAKLYTTSGTNTDGAMTQKAVGAAISTHNTATNAHSNIRGVAGGLATLDNNAKVPMSQINDALLGNVQYQGLYDVSTNTPNLDTVAPKGHYYIVSVAGDRFGLHFDVGDWVISTGEGWTKVDNTDAVVAVNGRTGNVVLGANDVGAYTKEEVDVLIGSGSKLPDQTGNAGKVLTTDGTTASWQAPSGGTRVIFREWEE